MFKKNIISVLCCLRYNLKNKKIMGSNKSVQRFNILPRGSVPKRDTILGWVHNFCTTGTCALKWTPRPLTTRTPENVERGRHDVITFPTRSTRCRAQALGVACRCLQRILNKELKF